VKALSKRIQKARDKEEARIGYTAVQHEAPEIMRQTVAMMLYAMSLRGYGKKRLHYFYDWFCSIMNMPSNVLGKVPKTKDVMKLLTEKYEIDFSRIHAEFKPFEEWYDD
jgi:hypothetical protein